jgi:hypothetical protein
MTLRLNFLAAGFVGLVLTSAAALAQAPTNTAPHLEKHGTATQLIVDGKPFLALAGELSNSSASSPAYMKPIWPRLVATHFNTVLATVSWELIEPEEGRFDFTLVDDLLKDARQSNMRLVLLWFGSWKNGKSTYQPLWVKLNQAKYPLVQNEEGHGLPTLSTFSETNREADARAFAALMRHLREADGSKHTVIMVQVENEVGVLDTPRDFCPAANQAFNGPVPKELMDYLQAHKDKLVPQLREAWGRTGLKTSGTWEEVFGKSTVNKQDWHAFSYLTEEIFMAWNYARYVGRVAAAGKAEYNIPMYVNTWIKQANSGWPGAYPSGGAQPQVINVWQAGAPAIDVLSPDIYAPNFSDWCGWYVQAGNPLFVPESSGDARGASQALWAFGRHDAIGYSPFGVDRSTGADSALGRAYDVMSQVAPLVLEHQGTGTMTAVLLESGSASQTVRLGNYNLQTRLSSSRNPAAAAGAAQPDRVAALFICTGPDDYVIVARSMNIYFTAATNPTDSVGLATVEEGVYADGKWIPGRRLNGDETPEWKALSFRGDGYTIQHVKLYRYH